MLRLAQRVFPLSQYNRRAFHVIPKRTSGVATTTYMTLRPLSSKQKYVFFVVSHSSFQKNMPQRFPPFIRKRLREDSSSAQQNLCQPSRTSAPNTPYPLRINHVIGTPFYTYFALKQHRQCANTRITSSDSAGVQGKCIRPCAYARI